MLVFECVSGHTHTHTQTHTHTDTNTHTHTHTHTQDTRAQNSKPIFAPASRKKMYTPPPKKTIYVYILQKQKHGDTSGETTYIRKYMYAYILQKKHEIRGYIQILQKKKHGDTSGETQHPLFLLASHVPCSASTTPQSFISHVFFFLST
jgi:hypothetical protein